MSTGLSSDDLLRIVLIVLAVIVLAPVLMMLLAVPMMGVGMMGGGWGGGMMGGTWGGGMTGGYSPLWGLVTTLIWVVVIGGVGYVLYRRFGGEERLTGTQDAAMEELRLAYARGELSDEEFENRRERLHREDQSES